jgi:thiol-disulfide isomerase/thioredoxin
VKVVGILLGLAGLVLLALFVLPLLNPEPGAKAPVPQTYSSTRSIAVSKPAEGLAAPEAPKAAAPASPAADKGEPAGPLCDRLFTEADAKSLSLPSGAALKAGPHPANAWTWVNLWAAWCKPCKEEMPAISAWADRVRGDGGALRVLFLSLDDDERQLRRYMDADGRAIAGDFLWVSDEGTRARFFGALGVTNPPTLPLQAVMDPQGRLRCVRVGSVAAADLDLATRTFGWR